MNRANFMKGADATIGALLVRLFGMVAYIRQSPQPGKPSPLSSPNRILVLRPGGMGDLLMLIPTLRKLHALYPSAQIDLVCEKRNLEVLSLAGSPATPLVYDARPLVCLRRLLKTRYDVVIDTEQFHNFSAIFGYFSGAPVRIGFNINPHRNPLYTHLVHYSTEGQECGQFLKLLEPFGVRETVCSVAGILTTLKPEIPVTIRDQILNFFGGKPYAAVHAGSSTNYKRWSSTSFAALARQLHAETGIGILLLGGRGEQTISSTLLQELTPKGVPTLSLAGKLSLSETAALLSKATLFVGGDSGLAHLAVAYDIPSVVLFGPSDHKKWATENSMHAVVRHPLPCAPCFIFGYHKPCRHVTCMQHIQVSEVLRTCRQVISSGRPVG